MPVIIAKDPSLTSRYHALYRLKTLRLASGKEEDRKGFAVALTTFGILDAIFI